MSTFASAAVTRVTPLDPAKHVNFTRGMVLGVDDFDQEFAYLSGRDRWIVRDLVGCGVVAGLDLSVGPPPAGEEEKGPRLAVSGGVAALPSGQLVCVSPAQCAYLGDWVDSRRAELDADSPPAGIDSPPELARAAVVLCYAECETDAVPIPGEPCRDEANLMAPSRVKDHFTLELRLDPPEHGEERGMARVAAWLAGVPTGDAGASLEDFLAGLRAADAGGHSPPDGVAIAAGREAEFLEAALDVWVTELRPRRRAPAPGCEAAGTGPAAGDDCLLLGEVLVPVELDAISGAIVLGDADEIAIDTTRRQKLVSLRMLQELLLARRGGAAGGARRAVVRLDTSPPEVAAEGLQVEQVDERVFHLIPDDFDAGADYAVTGAGIAAVADATPVVVELLDPDDPALAALLAGAGVTAPGVTVRAQTAGGDPPARGFSVAVDRIGGGA